MLNLQKNNEITVVIIYKNNNHVKVVETFPNGKDALDFLKKVFSETRVPLLYKATAKGGEVKLPFPNVYIF